MDSNLRAVIREQMNRTQASIEEMDTAWIAGAVAQDPAARKLAYKASTYRQGFVDGLQWVLDHMDTVPVSTKGVRPPSAADRIEAWLAAHPEDNALSHRELAGRVGLSKTAVANWRVASTSVHNVEPVLE